MVWGGGEGREGVKPHLRYFETITTVVFLKMFVHLFDVFDYVRQQIFLLVIGTLSTEYNAENISISKLP